LFYVLLLGFALISLGWSLPAALLARLLSPARGRPLGQRAIGRGFSLYLGALQATGMLRCDLSALDALRDEPGLVIAPNHPSLLDAVLLTSRLPRVVCIAKAAIWDNPLLGGGMRLAGYVRNDAPVAMIRDAAAALRAGRQVLIFPEGTRTPRGSALGPVRRSFALIARQAGVPVQTVVIETDSPYLRKGWSPFRRPPLPLRFTVRLGERFTPDASTDARLLGDAVQRHLQHALGETRSGDNS
jgi:1-acyl-sn-glycerol-3-phosphate acyltransferase